MSYDYELLGSAIFEPKNRCRDGVTFVVFVRISCPACILSSLHLVSVVFGTAFPTSLYIS